MQLVANILDSRTIEHFYHCRKFYYAIPGKEESCIPTPFLKKQVFLFLKLQKFYLGIVSIYQFHVYNIMTLNFYKLYSILSYYNIGQFPCIIQYILLSYFIHTSLCFLIPYPFLTSSFFPLSPGNHQFVLCACKSVSVLFILFFRFHK